MKWVLKLTESALNLRKFCEFLNKVLIYFPLERITKEIASSVWGDTEMSVEENLFFEKGGEASL